MVWMARIGSRLHKACFDQNMESRKRVVHTNSAECEDQDEGEDVEGRVVCAALFGATCRLWWLYRFGRGRGIAAILSSVELGEKEFDWEG